EELQQIIDASGRAATLTNQLLTFSRKQVIQAVPLNLNDVVKRIEKMLRRLIGEHILLQNELDEDIGSIKADPGQMEQVLMNLAVNARDAMPRGGALRFKTSRATWQHPRYDGDINIKSLVLLTVSDTGCGIDTATME